MPIDFAFTDVELAPLRAEELGDEYADDIMTVEEFRRAVAERWFDDDDGVGVGMISETEEAVPVVHVLPSTCRTLPTHITHVNWFNK